MILYHSYLNDMELPDTKCFILKGFELLGFFFAVFSKVLSCDGSLSAVGEKESLHASLSILDAAS